MKKFKIKTAKTKLHKLWSMYVRLRDKNTCQWCGRYEEPGNAHHIVAKGVCRNSGSYEVENGMTLCVNCHRNRIPTQPDEYIIFRDKYLKDRNLNYFDLRAKYQEPIKFTQDFYNLKSIVLTEMCSELLGESST